jgi:probable F420-dependent oxidoreductase
MQLNVTLPFDQIKEQSEFLVPGAVKKVCTLLESAGFAGANVTDHPCPTGRWLDAGGHHAQDPFVLLSIVAAHTSTLRLQTGILVLPYRNPFITARAVATLDVFSGGRVTLGVGAGYLKGEYRALGVDFERRNEIMDEYIRALKAAWCNDEFTFEGTGYQALGNRILPRPLQRPHPPILIGGNSKRAIRRAVELGDAWNPFFASEAVSATARTAEITNASDLSEAMKYMHGLCENLGRAQAPEVVLGSIVSPGLTWNTQEILDKIEIFAELGVRKAAVHIAGSTLAEWCDTASRFGAEVISQLPKR